MRASQFYCSLIHSAHTKCHINVEGRIRIQYKHSMMTDPNIPYVVASYAIAGIVLLYVTIMVVVRQRQASKILKDIDARHQDGHA